MWTLDPPPLVLGAIGGAGEPAFSRSCESAARECWEWERDPGRSWAGPRAKELVLEDSFSENIVAAHMGRDRYGTAAESNIVGALVITHSPR